jgi:hypothetical protein
MIHLMMVRNTMTKVNTMMRKPYKYLFNRWGKGCINFKLLLTGHLPSKVMI